MLRSMSNSISRCSLGASYVGDLMLQRSMKVTFVFPSSPTWFNGSIKNNFIILSSVISLINYVTESLS
ncbi:hypothetical protein MTR_3g069290 [Medicago truncatula]|uniref:Uncharacterized protein n=1 Tax=Medicago truncatula TaxID=3880 RepID=G7JA08_MEDTR|nr:hypothetical protein MTR_3g069290 [Medicago truncatula]